MDDQPGRKRAQQRPGSAPPWSAGQGGPRLYADLPTVPIAAPAQKRGKRRMSPTAIALIIFSLLLILGGGALTAGYIYYTRIHQPLAQFIRPVSRRSIRLRPPISSMGARGIFCCWAAITTGNTTSPRCSPR